MISYLWKFHTPPKSPLASIHLTVNPAFRRRWIAVIPEKPAPTTTASTSIVVVGPLGWPKSSAVFLGISTIGTGVVSWVVMFCINGSDEAKGISVGVSYKKVKFLCHDSIIHTDHTAQRSTKPMTVAIQTSCVSNPQAKSIFSCDPHLSNRLQSSDNYHMLKICTLKGKIGVSYLQDDCKQDTHNMYGAGRTHHSAMLEEKDSLHIQELRSVWAGIDAVAENFDVPRTVHVLASSTGLARYLPRSDKSVRDTDKVSVPHNHRDLNPYHRLASETC